MMKPKARALDSARSQRPPLPPPQAPTENDEGLLEYLEDIIGSNRLKEPIDEKQKAVEGLNEKRAVELNRVKAAEQQRDDLAPRKAEAEQYIATEAQLNAKKGALYQLREGEAQAAEAAIAKEKEELEATREETREKGKVRSWAPTRSRRAHPTFPIPSPPPPTSRGRRRRWTPSRRSTRRR